MAGILEFDHPCQNGKLSGALFTFFALDVYGKGLFLYGGFCNNHLLQADLHGRLKHDFQHDFFEDGLESLGGSWGPC